MMQYAQPSGQVVAAPPPDPSGYLDGVFVNVIYGLEYAAEPVLSHLSGSGNTGAVSGARYTVTAPSSSAAQTLVRLKRIDGQPISTPAGGGVMEAFVHRISASGGHVVGFLAGVTDWTPATFTGWKIGLNGYLSGSGFNYAFAGRYVSGVYAGESFIEASGAASDTWMRLRIDGDRLRFYVGASQGAAEIATPVKDILLHSFSGDAGLIFETDSAASPYVENIRIQQ